MLTAYNNDCIVITNHEFGTSIIMSTEIEITHVFFDLVHFFTLLIGRPIDLGILLSLYRLHIEDSEGYRQRGLSNSPLFDGQTSDG